MKTTIDGYEVECTIEEFMKFQDVKRAQLRSEDMPDYMSLAMYVETFASEKVKNLFAKYDELSNSTSGLSRSLKKGGVDRKYNGQIPTYHTDGLDVQLEETLTRLLDGSNYLANKG